MLKTRSRLVSDEGEFLILPSLPTSIQTCFSSWAMSVFYFGQNVEHCILRVLRAGAQMDTAAVSVAADGHSHCQADAKVGDFGGSF